MCCEINDLPFVACRTSRAAQVRGKPLLVCGNIAQDDMSADTNISVYYGAAVSEKYQYQSPSV